MAELIVQDQELVVRLSVMEKVMSVRGDVHVPVADVTGVEVEDEPYSALRGARSPGVAVPGLAAYGWWRWSGDQRDFVALRGARPALRVTLNNRSDCAALLVTVEKPETTRQAVAAAAGLTPAEPGAVVPAGEGALPDERATPPEEPAAGLPYEQPAFDSSGPVAS